MRPRAFSAPPEADPTDPFDIFSLFNSNLGKPGCLTGNGWYYGLDNNEPANRIDLLAMVLHEFGHGLGFSLGVTRSNSGARFVYPSVWERYMYDMSAGKTWLQMASNGERAASARNDGNRVWIGQKASNVVPSVLDRAYFIETVRPSGVPTGEAWVASFGGQLSQAPGRRTGGNLAAPNDGGGVSLLDGCEPFPSGANLTGRWVLVNRGKCAFVQKAVNAQNAGAAGLLIANNAAGNFSPSGADPSITILSAGDRPAAAALSRAPCFKSCWETGSFFSLASSAQGLRGFKVPQSAPSHLPLTSMVMRSGLPLTVVSMTERPS